MIGPRIALVSTYVPRPCGLATFARDLATAVAEHGFDSSTPVEERFGVFALNDPGKTYGYGPEVVFQVGQEEGHEYLDAADAINDGPFDVVCVQHDYSIFGGKEGGYLLPLLQRLRKPVVSTLHTLLREPSPEQRDVLMRMCRHSAALVVMCRRAATWLSSIYAVPSGRIHMIHHGAPDVPFTDTEPAKARLGLAGRPTLLTFGLLHPNKGIEDVLDALRQVVPDHPNLLYLVVGATHGSMRRRARERYRDSLKARVSALGLEANVRFLDRFLSRDELREHLLATDIYVSPNREREQIAAGTLANAIATGRAILSTPYWYAEELLAEGRGLLFDFGDVDALAARIGTLLEDRALRETMRHAAYEYGRDMTWSTVGGHYGALLGAQARVRVTTDAGGA